MFLLHNADGVRIGDFYLCHGQVEHREEFNGIIESVFEVRK